jgi:NitT/TauT family transport system substrate-binding protein
MCLVIRGAVLFLLVIFATGCGREGQVPVDRPTLRKVSLQTDWFPQAEHGGFYQALAKGFYAEAGLEVDILPGGPGSGIKLKVAKGEADFGMNRSDDVLLAAAQGLPLTMVAATLQHDPMALMVHDASPVKTFRDLDGRAVIGNVGMAYFSFLEQRYGITFEKRQNTFGLGEFLANPETIQQCVVTNEPFFARQHGRKVRTLALADSGYDSYHVIFCRRELVRNAPAVVRAFVQASVRGWRDYITNDPAAAHAVILKRNPQMSAELLQFSRTELVARHLVEGDPAKSEDIGQLSIARLTEQRDTLLALKILQKPIEMANIVATEFLSAPALRAGKKE